ncbi:uncharacterized protein LOC126619740 [Malus sylvestris]|uniref:uncharacterized protein LOC126619740 n=1 Tax=Malus sylvestris TaxID=3752 RepID=UPI0021AD22E5|nr:uncharacterized protein LOC126619740 [Malus sylvestris]
MHLGNLQQQLSYGSVAPPRLLEKLPSSHGSFLAFQSQHFGYYFRGFSPLSSGEARIDMYQSMGDVLAQQYGGSAAHNTKSLHFFRTRTQLSPSFYHLCFALFNLCFVISSSVISSPATLLKIFPIEKTQIIIIYSSSPQPSALSSFFASVGLKVDSFAVTEADIEHCRFIGTYILLRFLKIQGFSDFGSLFVGCKILCSQEDSSINIVSNGETTGFPVTPHNEQLSYASTSKKRLDTISDSAKESKQSVFIMDTHTFEMYTSSLNKRTSSSPKKLSQCSIHLPQSNFDKEDPVNNGIGDDPKS